VILYECACGERPYEARAIEPLVVLIHEGKAAALHERRPALPRDFCDIVHRAMAVERDQRFDSARSLREALASLRIGAPRVATPVQENRVDELGATLLSDPPSPHKRRLPWRRLIGAGSLAVAGAAILTAFSRPPGPIVQSSILPDASAPAGPPAPGETAATGAPIAATLPQSVDASAPKVLAQKQGKTSTRIVDSGVVQPSLSAASMSSSRADQARLLQNNPFPGPDGSAKP
jgi:hypothetical protein